MVEEQRQKEVCTEDSEETDKREEEGETDRNGQNGYTD